MALIQDHILEPTEKSSELGGIGEQVVVEQVRVGQNDIRRLFDMIAIGVWSVAIENMNRVERGLRRRKLLFNQRTHSLDICKLILSQSLGRGHKGEGQTDRQRVATSKKEERRRGEQGRYCRSYLAFVGNTISAVSERLIRRASRTGRRYKRDFPGGRERPIQNREREREFKPLAVDVDTMTWRAWVDVD
jgi:hypothetical protein